MTPADSTVAEVDAAAAVRPEASSAADPDMPPLPQKVVIIPHRRCAAWSSGGQGINSTQEIGTTTEGNFCGAIMIVVLHSLCVLATVLQQWRVSSCSAPLQCLRVASHALVYHRFVATLRRALGRQDAAFVVHALCFMAHVRVWGWHTSEQASGSPCSHDAGCDRHPLSVRCPGVMVSSNCMSSLPSTAEEWVFGTGTSKRLRA